jgi:hypothetical protein
MNDVRRHYAKIAAAASIKQSFYNKRRPCDPAVPKRRFDVAFWPEADMKRRPLTSPLAGVKRTRRARFEDFRF